MATTPFLAKSLTLLRASINEAFPKRDKSSDGWIGDASHQARPSDHNPDWNAPGSRRGVVRAIDVDVDDNDPYHDLRRELLNSTIAHRAVWYVISNGIIYSRTYNWAARQYTGPNGHFKHVHVSIRHTEIAENDTTLKLIQRAIRNTTISMVAIQKAARGEVLTDTWLDDAEQFAAFVSPTGVSAVPWQTFYSWHKAPWGNKVGQKGYYFTFMIEAFQKKMGLEVDGIFGEQTAQAMERYGYTVN